MRFGLLGFCATGPSGLGSRRTIFSNARRNASLLSSASIWRAASMKRFDCSGLSGFGFFRFGCDFGFPVMLLPDEAFDT
jgi:hypothetical protein